MRSHPNKAVDVDACQTSKISGLHPINSCLVCSSPVVHGCTVLVCLHPSTRLPLRLPPPAPGVPPAPGSLSAEPGVTAHIPRRSPTDGAVIPPAFAPLPPRLASWHSSRLARTAVVRSGVSLCPARMDPGCSVRSPPAADATSCPHLGDAQLRLAVPRVLLLRHQSQIGPYVSTLDEALRV